MSVAADILSPQQQLGGDLAVLAMWRQLGSNAKFSVFIGTLVLITGLADGRWLMALIGVGLIAGGGWTGYTKILGTRTENTPWPWPPEFRELAEAMAQPVDPTPMRVVPPHEKAAMVAQVATTQEAIAKLMADKPPAWPWALFASVMVVRRNAMTDRLRRCASGYQPGPGTPLSGQSYCQTAVTAMNTVVDLAEQTNQFVLSPAFTGAFGEPGKDATADAEAIVAVTNRLMDYHEAYLRQAEVCLQTPVKSEAMVFVQDMGAFTLCPLVGFEEFIPAMCARIGEVQEVLPYADPRATVWFDDVALRMTVPDGLSPRITAHFRRFSQTAD